MTIGCPEALCQGGQTEGQVLLKLARGDHGPQGADDLGEGRKELRQVHPSQDFPEDRLLDHRRERGPSRK